MTGTRFADPATDEEYGLIAAREMAFTVCRIIRFRNRTRPEDVLGECWMEVRKRKYQNPALRFTPQVIDWAATDVARRLTGRADRSVPSRMGTEVENIIVRQYRVELADRAENKPEVPTPLGVWCDYRAARINMLLPWRTRIILYLHVVEGWTYKEIGKYIIGSESGVANHLIANLGKPLGEFVRDARGVTERAESPDGPAGAPAQPAGLDPDRLPVLLPAVEPVPPRI